MQLFCETHHGSSLRVELPRVLRGQALVNRGAQRLQTQCRVREEGDWNTRQKLLRSKVVYLRPPLAFCLNHVTEDQFIQEFPE